MRDVSAASLRVQPMTKPEPDQPRRGDLRAARGARSGVAGLDRLAPPGARATTTTPSRGSATLLLRAARFEAGRRRDALRFLRPGELDDIAEEAAGDALLAVLAHLDDFRGLSRFTTWAYKFALLEAAVKLRRRAWQDREVPVEAAAWDAIAARTGDPAVAAERRELLRAVQAAIEGQLTPHQRRVLVALAVQGVPIDVLAERLSTTRGALYKTLHDARRKLRRELAAAGFDLDVGEEVP